MITMKIKDQFFDRVAVQKAMTEVERGALSRAAAYIWRRARSSMRKRKGISKPGSPPSVHEGSLKRMLYFGWDQATRSVVIGPVGFNNSKVPAVLEFGGDIPVKKVVGGKLIKTVKWRNQYGTGEKEIRSGGRRQIVPVPVAPRPYMGPAFDKERDKAPGEFKDRMRRDT